jgi:lysozyme family protein
MFMSYFDDAMKYILEVEGIYSNDESDLGGETYAGISRRSHANWEGWRLVDKAKSNGTDLRKKFISVDGICLLNLVKYFYKKNYWEPLKLDGVLDRNVAIKIFDIGINMGIKRCVMMVQSCIALFEPIKNDGIIGNKTLASINSIDRSLLLKMLTIKQGHLYLQIVSVHPSQEKFLRGWINRLNITIGEF